MYFGKLMRTGMALLFVAALAGSSMAQDAQFAVRGEMKKWHPVTITFSGPDSSEQAPVNPFRDYRLTVTFKNGDTVYQVPGFYAADGDAAETSADSGNKWKVIFTPDQIGEWQFTVSFLKGRDVALDLKPQIAQPVAFDGATGSFVIQPSDKRGRDFRAKGTLQYVGEHYLQFKETGDYFLKGGADSPENFLAYYEFDQTYCYAKKDDPKKRSGEADLNTASHKYEPHANDWVIGDPIWQGGKGKNIIGALNYLAQAGMNSVYFLTMNVAGDGKDVWPWTSHDERFRFDCSKLEQWDIVFRHMDSLGLMLHVITQEQENDQLLDEGQLGRERKLYYRELIARFSYHLGLVWNLGEENTNTDRQRAAFAEYIHALDPYKHPIVVHTFPGRYEKVYKPLLGNKNFHGPSLQMGNQKLTHEETIKWRHRSDNTEQKWVVCLDEIGPAHTGVKPDKDDPRHDDVRHYSLWGNLLGGGAGCEWYFGYKYAHNDLNCEDWRSRDLMWKQTKIALDFFHQNLPFWEMQPADDYTTSQHDYCFASPGEVYAMYLPEGGTTELSLADGTYRIYWVNPRESAELLYGSKAKAKGPGKVSIGQPPYLPNEDWVVLVEKVVETKPPQQEQPTGATTQ